MVLRRAQRPPLVRGDDDGRDAAVFRVPESARDVALDPRGDVRVTRANGTRQTLRPPGVEPLSGDFARAVRIAPPRAVGAAPSAERVRSVVVRRVGVDSIRRPRPDSQDDVPAHDRELVERQVAGRVREEDDSVGSSRRHAVVGDDDHVGRSPRVFTGGFPRGADGGVHAATRRARLRALRAVEVAGVVGLLEVHRVERRLVRRRGPLAGGGRLARSPPLEVVSEPRAGGSRPSLERDRRVVGLERGGADAANLDLASRPEVGPREARVPRRGRPYRLAAVPPRRVEVGHGERAVRRGIEHGVPDHAVRLLVQARDQGPVVRERLAHEPRAQGRANARAPERGELGEGLGGLVLDVVPAETVEGDEEHGGVRDGGDDARRGGGRRRGDGGGRDDEHREREKRRREAARREARRRHL